MNRAVDRNWKQGGIYVVCTTDLSDPGSWSEPVRLLEHDGWYPQVIGSDTAKRETGPRGGVLSAAFYPREVHTHPSFF
jgi:hypothetical protein